VRPPEIEFEVRERNDMLGNIVLLAISILTGAYLLAALLWPERF
jgi:K+-transporting ATPase KdpF subunit